MNILNSILTKIIPSAGKSEPAVGRPSPLLPTDSNLNASNNQVDVDEILRGLEDRNEQKLDWRHSIVDLMKLLGMGRN